MPRAGKRGCPRHRAGRWNDRPSRRRRHLGLLVWWLVVENLLTLFLPEQVSRFLPFFAGNGPLGIQSDTTTPESIAVALTRPEDALVFGGYTTHWLSDDRRGCWLRRALRPSQQPARGLPVTGHARLRRQPTQREPCRG